MFKGLIRSLVRKIINSSYIDSLIHFTCVDKVILGQSSRFYRQAKVENMSGEKEKISIGSNSYIRGELLVFPYGGEITIGDYCYVGEDTRIWSGESIVIGNHVLIAHNVNISDFSHETNHAEREQGFKKLISTGHPKSKGEIPTAPVVIEDNVAIYPQVNIARGVRIGKGSIISAGSVVFSDVPPFTLIMGNPGRKMMKLS